ncbi:MAG: tetratricopeptide repeat protein [Gammaproteobacteria bacterium]
MTFYSGLSRQLAITTLLLALALDAYALALLLFGPDEGELRWFVFFSTHGLASLLIAPSLWAALPDHLRREAVPGIALFFILCFYVPLLGALALFGAVVVTAFHPRRRKPDWMLSIRRPELPREIPRPSETVNRNASGLMSVLEDAREPEVRMRALLATRQMDSRDAIPLLRVALKDTVDEVRLMAYAMLDKKEKQLTRRIHELQEELEDHPDLDPYEQHFRIAENLWELAYLGLAQGEVLEHVLFNARKHLLKSLADEVKHPHGWFLMGRILLRQGELNEAGEAFKRARTDGLPLARVNPYLAEIAFAQSRFADMRRYIGKMRQADCSSAVLSRIGEAQR